LQDVNAVKAEDSKDSKDSKRKRDEDDDDSGFFSWLASDDVESMLPFQHVLAEVCLNYLFHAPSPINPMSPLSVEPCLTLFFFSTLLSRLQEFYPQAFDFHNNNVNEDADIENLEGLMGGDDDDDDEDDE
jgi:hypothetical protein